jgi:muskelin
VSSNTWKLLREDISAQTSGSVETIVSRTGHSMLFHSKLRLLFIFGGQRQRDTLRDFFTYNVDTNETNHICDGDRHELPAAGFAQKATIDNDLNEIHVLCVSFYSKLHSI